jgi:hypothetical protein
MKLQRARFPRHYVVRLPVLATIAIASAIVLVSLVALEGRASDSTLLVTDTGVAGSRVTVGDPTTRERRIQPEGLRPSARLWATDFSTHSVPLEEFDPAGPQKSGIPSIDEPQFTTTDEAASWIKPPEPVIELIVGDEVRLYPIQILIWHEIVNDVVGGVPIAVTFCPLCNTALAFDRRLADETLSFGVTGVLRNSDLVMFDRRTESWGPTVRR